ncbi:hypothetical protein EV361DRAFT_873020 [Lentinula raphanica]|nr:hypothetical protein EV361DRAFT_873020 [Lentinula raphanica]
MAIVLHPSWKLEYFAQANWVQSWIDGALDVTRDTWESTFKPTAPHIAPSAPEPMQHAEDAQPLHGQGSSACPFLCAQPGYNPGSTRKHRTRYPCGSGTRTRNNGFGSCSGLGSGWPLEHPARPESHTSNSTYYQSILFSGSSGVGLVKKEKLET